MATIDDYAANTSTTGKLVVPTKGSTSISGNIESKGDHDWFKVTLEANKAYSYRFITYEITPNGTKFSSDRFSLTVHDATGKPITGLFIYENADSYFTPKITGDYYINIGDSNNNIGKYAFDVERFIDDYAADKTTSGQVINNNIKGALLTPNDHDWFKLDLIAGKNYLWHSSDNFDLALFNLRDASGKLISGITTVRAFVGSTYTCTVSKSGSYFLDVSQKKPPIFEITSYDLTISEHSDAIGNIPALAQPITWSLNQPTVNITGVTDYAADIDMFALTLTKGYFYKFEVIVNEADDISIGTDLTFLHKYSILDNTGKTIDQIAKPNGISNPIIPTKTATYYVSVVDIYAPENAGGPVHPAYTIRVTKSLLLNGTAQNDTLNGDKTDNIANGFAGDDILNGGGGDDIINGGSGNDIINGGSGNDDLKGEQGNDVLDGGPGNDDLKGGLGNDKLISGPGKNSLYGDAGRDILLGNQEADLLNGGAGIDWLYGRKGDDQYYIDDPKDKVIESAASGQDTVYSAVNYTLPDNVEVLYLLDNATRGVGNTLNNSIIMDRATQNHPISSRLTLLGGAGDDTLSIGDYHTGTHFLYGGSGNDTLSARSGDRNTLEGGAGNDDLNAFSNLGNSSGILTGGSGNDTFNLYGYSNTTLVGGTGSDSYTIISSRDVTVQIHRGDSSVIDYDSIEGIINGITTKVNHHLDLDSEIIAANIASSNGKNTGGFKSHHIQNGLITFDDVDQYSTPLQLTTEHLPDAIRYLQTNISETGNTVIFNVAKDTYVFQDSGTEDTLVQLVGVTLNGISHTSVAGLLHLI